MKVVLFGATGMIGQGVLRECLGDPTVEGVLAVSRRAGSTSHAKLREIVHRDFEDFSSIAGDLTGYDACFFCIGVSSAGVSEQAYQRVTYDVALAAARVLVRTSPAMTFVFLSGAGADENSRVMWARIKGRTETALLGLPFKAIYVFRPAYVQPLHGITSRTRLYRLLYMVAGPLYPVWRAVMPGWVTTTEAIGRAMIAVAARGAPGRILETRDINRLAH